MHKNKIKKNIENLRTLMKKKGIDCYIVPHNDEYLSEYVPENKERLQWVTGFSGSAGTLLITLTELYMVIGIIGFSLIVSFIPAILAYKKGVSEGFISVQ